MFVATVRGSVPASTWPLLPHPGRGPLRLRHSGSSGPCGAGARMPPASAGALRPHRCARQTEASVIVCVCVCARARICVWDCACSWGQGQAGLQREGPCCGSRTSPLLGPAVPASGLPKCLRSLPRLSPAPQPARWFWEAERSHLGSGPAVGKAGPPSPPPVGARAVLVLVF